MDIADIKHDMNAEGSHWWDRDTMSFFGTKVSSQVYNGPGGVYFVTSDFTGFDRISRGYTIREYTPGGTVITTVGGIADYPILKNARDETKTLAKG